MKDIIPRIDVEESQYTDIKTFHSTSELSHSEIQIFKKPLADNYREALKKLGITGKFLIRNLFTITGIVQVAIEPYSIEVEKGAAFEWENMEDEILILLKETFGPESKNIEMSYSKTIELNGGCFREQVERV